ncbi:hypothetical protein DdX_11124 [Ditylenchus destructor]|uniref:F-box domain-containing protein n=1 Tax=Ditylenchus destructor TaxID=166010 RepID=A0AAD4N348_9BILA|nr:hypothetical protein DdX_11124 [Ditylenchus destructor]
MSYSKPLPSFVFDLLCYLDRDQLERFSIICRPLKNFIERYFHSKPYRMFDELRVAGGKYALRHNRVFWRPGRDDYSVEQFLAGEKCEESNADRVNRYDGYYSFAEMRPYLGPTIRIATAPIYIAGSCTYNLECIEEMESIAYLWHDGIIGIRHEETIGNPIVSEDIQPILNSPTILQCKNLHMMNTFFSFKDYKVLYTVKSIDIIHHCGEKTELWLQYWEQFFEQPGVKPVVTFLISGYETKNNLIDRISKAFSSAVLPNAFKIGFSQFHSHEPLTEFRETNNISGEKLELKKGLPVECQQKCFKEYDTYTFERSSI